MDESRSRYYNTKSRHGKNQSGGILDALVTAHRLPSRKSSIERTLRNAPQTLRESRLPDPGLLSCPRLAWACARMGVGGRLNTLNQGHTYLIRSVSQISLKAIRPAEGQCSRKSTSNGIMAASGYSERRNNGSRNSSGRKIVGLPGCSW